MSTLKIYPTKKLTKKYTTHLITTKNITTFFLKLDADMVLCKKNFLKDIIALLHSFKKIDDLQIGVHDFFTDNIVYGIHIYSKHACWKKNDNLIFVDKTDINNKYNIPLNDNIFTPAAWHCPNPSLVQSFHFGIHKAVKAMQMDMDKINPVWRKVHLNNIYSMLDQWNKRTDLRIGFALLGSFLAIKYKFDHRYLDFNNKEFLKYFNEYKKTNKKDVSLLLKKLFKDIYHVSKKFGFSW
jgi:hypothetical protein